MKSPLKVSIAIIIFCIFSTNSFAQFPKDPGDDPFTSQQKGNDIPPVSSAPESSVNIDLSEADSLNSETEYKTIPNSEIKNRKIKPSKKYKIPVVVSPKNFAVKERKKK